MGYETAREECLRKDKSYQSYQLFATNNQRKPDILGYALAYRAYPLGPSLMKR
jgi:hypothetical protein